MKTTVLIACLSAALMSSIAVAQEPVENLASTQTLTTIGANSEAIAILTAVNDHEVKAAEMALAKKPGAAVAEYAQMLQDDHTSNQEATRKIADMAGISGKGTPAVDVLTAKSKATRDRLSALKDDAFEAAFIKAMVLDHTEVLAKIDNELLPKATDAELVRHLQETRTHIQMHLEMARKLEGSLQASR